MNCSSIKLLKKESIMSIFKLQLIHHEGERIRSQDIYILAQYMSFLFILFFLLKFKASCLTLRVPHKVDLYLMLTLSSPTCEHTKFILLSYLHFCCPCHYLECSPVPLLSKVFSMQYESSLAGKTFPH